MEKNENKKKIEERRRRRRSRRRRRKLRVGKMNKREKEYVKELK